MPNQITQRKPGVWKITSNHILAFSIVVVLLYPQP